MALRIALVSEHASPLLADRPAGGARHQYVAELAAGLARLGNQVTVHTRADDPSRPVEVPAVGGYLVLHAVTSSVPQVPYKEMPRFGEFAAVLAAAWRRDRPDVVHAHGWTSGMAALLAARELDVPLVQTYHGLEAGAPGHRAGGGWPQRMLVERLVGRRADHIVATCEDEVAQLMAMRVPRSRVVVVPYGVDCGLFTPALPRPGRRSQPTRLLAVGRLVPEEGMGDLVAAVAKVPACELVIAGGPLAAALDTDPTARRLRLLGERTGAAGRVRLVGQLPRTELATLMRLADVVACVPWHRSSGLVALEAMASGTAVVASDVDGLRDIVVPGVTGELVEPRRLTQLAATLARLTVDPVSLESYGAAGRDRAQSRFQWARLTAETARVYHRVVTARAGQPSGGPSEVPARA